MEIIFQITASLGYSPKRSLSWKRESFIKNSPECAMGGCRGAETCLWCKPLLQLRQSLSHPVQELASTATG